MPSILVLGDINVDVLMDVPAYPPPGGEAVTERLITRLGGSAANTAVVLSRLGLEARMLGRVGSDPWGQMALAALAEAGVGLELVQQDEAVATGLMFTAVTPDGERTMFGQRGANPLTDPSAISPDILGGADLLYLSGYALLEAPQREAAARAVELARQRGLPIVLDTAYMPALVAPQELRPYLPCLDACILGLPEACALLGEVEPQAASICAAPGGRSPCGCEARRAGLPAGRRRFRPLHPGISGGCPRYHRRGRCIHRWLDLRAPARLEPAGDRHPRQCLGWTGSRRPRRRHSLARKVRSHPFPQWATFIFIGRAFPLHL